MNPGQQAHQRAMQQARQANFQASQQAIRQSHLAGQQAAERARLQRPVFIGLAFLVGDRVLHLF